jgi:hypothetical protein
MASARDGDPLLLAAGEPYRVLVLFVRDAFGRDVPSRRSL